MKKTILLGMIVALCCRPCAAQNVPPQLDTLLRKALDSIHIVMGNKGMSAAVSLPDGATWKGAVGISTSFANGSLKTNQILNIGSVTKTLTSACVLQMADEGLLSLNDSLHRWLDTFDFISPNLTLRQLLRHQSGLFDYLYHPNYQPFIQAVPDSVWALRDVIKTFKGAPTGQPGAAYAYCNTNYILLGMVIEKVSGLPYHQAIRTRLLTPQGLSTVLLPPQEPFAPQPVAHLWFDLDGNGTLEDAHGLFSTWKAWYSTIGPAGGFFSTAADMARWVRYYMDGSLFTPATLAEAKMTITGSGLPNGTKYGLGVMERTISGQKAFGHGGDAGYSAGAWFFPNKDIGIAVLNNDAFFTSWELLPAVSALLKAYQKYELQTISVDAPDATSWAVHAAPNPFVDGIDLRWEVPTAPTPTLDFVLLDAQGVEVARTQADIATGQHRMEGLDTLPNGAYFLMVYAGGKPVSGVVCLK